MKEYEIVAIFWEDHYSALAAEIPKNPDNLVEIPTLTVGILLSETDKTLMVAHDIERYDDRDASSFSVILKKTVVGIQKYGTIELESLRRKGED